MSNTKWCSGCQQRLAVEEFGLATKRSDGLQPSCRECVRRHNREWYTAHRRQVRHRVKARRKKLRDLVWRLKCEGFCIDCNESDPRVLDFDHVTGDKAFDISHAGRHVSTEARLRTELAKCVLRCANCHRRRTYDLQHK